MRAAALTVITALAASALALSACDPTDAKDDTATTGLDCSAIAVYSTNVTVEDAGGETIADPSLSYEAGDQSGPCEEYAGTWSCGIEIAGPMTITGDAPGYAEASVEVDIPMDADGCHPVPQEVTLTLVLL